MQQFFTIWGRFEAVDNGIRRISNILSKMTVSWGFRLYSGGCGSNTGMGTGQQDWRSSWFSQTLPATGARGGAVRWGTAPEGRGFDSRWCHWNSSLTQSSQPHYGPGIDTASNRNEYQEYFLGGKGGRCWQPYHFHVLNVLKSWSVNVLEPSGSVQACNGIALPFPPGNCQDSYLKSTPFSTTFPVHCPQNLYSVGCW
jgi:hypothetical protein